MGSWNNSLGFENNILKNFDRKQTNYTFLLSELRKSYSMVTYANLSMGACGIVGKSSNLLNLIKEMKGPDSDSLWHITNIINICSRSMSIYSAAEIRTGQIQNRCHCEITRTFEST